MINHKELRIETNGHLLQTECVTVGNLYGWTVQFTDGWFCSKDAQNE